MLKTETDASAAIAAGVEAKVVAGLCHLYSAFQKSSIYAAGHPAAIEAIRQSSLGLMGAAGGSLLIGVGCDGLMLDGNVLRDESGSLQSLAALLRDLDVSALRIETGVGVGELDGLVQILGQARREGLHGDALAEMLVRKGVRHVRIVPFGNDGAERPAPVPEAHDDVWESLEGMLTSRVPSADEVPPEAIAERIHQELELNEGTGVGALRERIQEVSREIDSIGAERRNQVRERLSKFVAALNPKLRQDLLRFDPHLSGDSLALMTELGDVVPETDLLEALQNLDRAGARVPEQLITLMSKLLRVARTRPSLASGLQDTMSKWGVSTTAMGDEMGLRAALEEVFRRGESLECNPIPHQELLDTLARYDFGTPTNLSLSRYRNPEDMEDVRRQTAEIASRMVALPGGEEHRAGLFHYLQDSTDRLIDAGLFEQVRDVAVAAHAYTVLETGSEPTYRSARSYLNHLKNDERVRRILGSACTLDPFPLAAVNLLELLGDRGVGPSMAALIEIDSPPAIEALQCFLAERDPEHLRPELVARLERGWSSWQKIFAVLRRMPAERAHSLVELLLDHEEFEVRREALMLLHDLGGDRELRLTEVHRALTDDSARFARVAVRCLAEMDGDEPLDMLGAYLDGGLGVTPVFDAGVRAAQSMLRLKNPGVRRLCRASKRMRRSLDPRRAALGRKVVELLATEDDLRARACVKAWRFSPAWWVALFVPRPQGSELRSSQ